MSLISEVATYLAAQGLGTLGTDIFYSKLPDTSQDVELAVIDRTGPAPDPYLTDIKRPMFQVVIRAKDYATGRAKLTSVRELLHGVINTYLVASGIYFRKIIAMQEGGHIGINDAGRDEFSINFMCEVIEP